MTPLKRSCCLAAYFVPSKSLEIVRFSTVAGVRLNDVLPRLCPSLPSLRGKSPFLVQLVHRYYGTVRLLQHVHVRRAAYGLRGPALIIRQGALEISRFSS